MGQFLNRFFGLVDKWRIESTLDHFDFAQKSLRECIGVSMTILRAKSSPKGKFIQHFIGGSKMHFWQWCWLGIFSVPNGPFDHSPLDRTTGHQSR